MKAQETGTSVKDTLTRALEAYFAHRLEAKTLAKISEKVFKEWNNLKDAEYDKL